MTHDNPYFIGVQVLAGRALPVEVQEESPMEVDLPLSPVKPPVVVDTRVLKSELEGVSDDAWTRFVRAMKTQGPAAISASNAFGMFEMRPKRLEDLGLMTELSSSRSPTGRMVWTGKWVAPVSEKVFLENPRVQYKVWITSIKLYVDSIYTENEDLPSGISLSGALAILHRCGPRGLINWGDTENRFPETIDLVERTNNVF